MPTGLIMETKNCLECQRLLPINHKPQECWDCYLKRHNGNAYQALKALSDEHKDYKW